MMFFLQLVGAIFVALILLVLSLLLYIKFKFRSAFGKFAEMLKNLGTGDVPPFRIKLKPISTVIGEGETIEDLLNEPGEFQDYCQEFESLGFSRIEVYYVDEIGLSIGGYVHRGTSSYGVVYDHPAAGVWCDVVRHYEDGSEWTYGNNQDSLMDYPDGKTIKYFPDLSLTEMYEKFLVDSPDGRFVVVPEEEFARFFERSYAEEMDWRIARGGATEAEIRRICERDGTECTPETIATIQMQWRTAISDFYAERALRRFRKEQNLTRDEWEQLHYDSAVVHQEMQAEEILQVFDDEYYPGSPFDMPDDSDPEYVDMRQKWNEQLEQIREQLKTTPPHQILKSMIEENSNPAVIWEYRGSVQEPIPADIWLRKWKDPDEEEYDDDWDDDDDWDE